MQDVRALLMRSFTIPQKYRAKTNFAVLHWNGPSVMYKGAYPGDLNILQADARWHVINNGWDGLAYHYAVGREGQQYQCRDWTAKLPHSGNSLMNDEAFSVLAITGDGDPISSKQYDILYERLKSTGISRRFWLGHQEAPRSTACPGALLMRWLWNLRHEVNVQSEEEVKILFAANVRDEYSTLSAKLGTRFPGETVSGIWRLGNPVKGDSLWLELKGDQYIHASALDTRSYVYAS